MDNDFKEAIGREQLRLVMQQVPTMLAASVVVALVLSYSVRGIVPRWNILFFVLSISAVAASRVILYRRFLNASTKPFVAKNWKSAYLLLSLISGIVWGGSAFLILPHRDPWLLALFVLVMASLSASTTVSHSSIKWAPAAFIVPSMLLYAIRCILDGGEHETILAFLVVLYLIVMVQYSLKHHGTIASSIVLRFENLKLLEVSRQSEERLRVILDSTDDGILAVDASGKTIFSNRRFAELWCIPQSLIDTGDDHAMLGFVLEQLVDPDGFLREVKRLYGTADLGIDTILFKDGGRRFERYSMPIRDYGSVIGRLWSFRDITERKRAEEELKEGADRLVEAQKIAHLGYYALDVATGVWTSSKILDDLFGIGEEYRRDVEGWSLLIHPEERQSMLDYFRNDVLGKKEPFDREYRIVRESDKCVRWVHGLGKVERDSRSKPVKMIGTIQDVTERRQTEEEREKLQGQLQQAMKMEAVGRLAGGIAHDFNNLMTVVSGYSELLLQKMGKGSPLYGQLEEIKRAGDRAAALTQQLLAFSRKQIIEPKVVHLDSLVAEVHAMLTRLIGEDIELQTTTGKALGSVKVDPGQFQQILMNLAVNARDAMPGGGKIVIETANVDLDEGYCSLHHYVKPGRFVMLAISDTGKGMSEEVKAHIFEPFFTTKEMGRGTGLGLATTYGFVKQTGGSIEAYSEVGVGTTFKIYLPRVEEEAAIPVKDGRPTDDLPGGTETVLLVEDEDALLYLCTRILGGLGYNVMQARNGAEAVAAAVGHAGRIDLLLTDVVMPGMSGSELATQMVLHHPEMKVLFTSGYTDDTIVHHGVLDDGVSFIGKPYSLERLARQVREVLDKA